MPVSFNSPPRNFFLLGSGGEDAVTNFFHNINRTNPQENQHSVSDIAYTEVDQKYLLSGSAETGSTVSYGWMEKRDYDSTVPSASQEWQNKFISTTLNAGTNSAPDTTLNFMKQTLSYGGDIIVGGKTGNTPWIAKYNANGVQQWMSTSQSADVKYVSVACKDYCYYACGYSDVTGQDGSAFIEKWDDIGTPQWGKSSTRLGGDVKLNSIAANDRGEVVAVGEIDGEQTVGYVVKVDMSTGDILWDLTIDSGEVFSSGLRNPVTLNSVYVDGNDQIYIVGQELTTEGGVHSDGVIFKYTAEGNLIWQKRSAAGEQHIYSEIWSDTEVEQTIVLSHETVAGSPTKKGPTLIKYSKNGDVVFKRRIQSSTNTSQVNYGLDGDPSFYYVLFVDEDENVSTGASKTYNFGKVSASGNGFGEFTYDATNSKTITYAISSSADRLGRLSDGSVRNDSSDLISYPYNGLKTLFDDYATNIAYKKTRHAEKDVFAYSGSPAIRVADFQELNLLGNVYSGSGDWLDQSGKGNNGTVNGPTNNAAGYWDFAGTPGLGAGDTINFGDTSTYNWIHDRSVPNWTIEGWFWNDRDEEYGAMISNNAGTSAVGFYMGQRNDKKFECVINKGTTGTQACRVLSTNDLEPDTWYHIAFVNENYTVKLYVDGVLQSNGGDQNSFSAGSTANAQTDLRIGKLGTSSAWNLDGRIGEVRIYKDKSLTATAVSQNYNASKSKYITEAPDTAPRISPGILKNVFLLLNYDFGNRASYDPIENLFPNSNLCQDTSTAIPYGWDGWNPSEFLKMPHLNGPFGTKDVKVVAHGSVNQNGGGLRGEMTGLVPGATYTVSAYVRKISEEELAYWNANNSRGLTTGTTDGAQDVSWFAATKCRWDLQNISGTGESPASQIVLSDQWQRIERDFPASSDGKKRLILSNNVADTGTGNEDGGGVFLIAALQLERKFNTLFGGNNKAGLWFATPYDSAIPSTLTVKNLISEDNFPGTLNGVAYNKSGHFDFEGTDDNIQLTGVFPNGNNAWTWSAWIKPHYATDGTPLFAGTESAGQAMVSFCQDGAVRVGVWGSDLLTAGTAIADDTWGMTTWTFDGSTLKCYTNGQIDGTASSVTFNVTGSSVRIGSTLTTQFFGGGIAQVQIYERALTAEEVLQNYDATAIDFNRADPYVAVTNAGYTPPTPGGDLYAFTSAYFTVSQALTDDTTSQEHRFGPSQAEVRGWLSGTTNGGEGHTWANSYVDCPQDGYQRWQVPKTGKYTITAKGGGAGQCQQGYIGRGVKVIADFNLTKGDYLILAAGQGVPDDLNSDSCNGGGGATWVMSGSDYTTAIPLIVANGAGGDSSDGSAKDQPNIVLGSSFTVTPTAAQGGGAAVTGKQTQPILSNVWSSLAFGQGDNDTTQPNSAGWLTDGADVPGETPGIGGHCFRTDLIGGNRSDSSAGHGGFGGGSGGQDEEGNAGGGFTGAHGNDNNDKTGHGSTFVNDNNQGNVSVQLAQATTTYQNNDYTSEDQYQGWIKIEFVS